MRINYNGEIIPGLIIKWYDSIKKDLIGLGPFVSLLAARLS